jgi:alcohol dehydrogenase
MHAMLVRTPGTKLEWAELPLPEPGRGEVRVRVRACGICHSDSLTVENHWPGISFPRAPGHEIAGEIDALGADVTNWNLGARVGIGWSGGYDGTCRQCLRGDFVSCINVRIPGIAYDGGYAQYVVAQSTVLAPIPDALSFEEAAPLMCAGITTFNALRHAGAMPGDLVAILGIGGLGHLGIQFAAKMGFQAVAIARGRDKGPLARTLGAHDYIDSSSEDVTERLLRLGGARVVLATVTSSAAMAPALRGLGADGVFLIVGAAMEPLPITPAALIAGRKSIKGWPSGNAIDSAETLRFSEMTGVRPMVETMPLERANEAYERMMSGATRFRMVLTS